MDERKEKVLRAVIREYISNAQPVSSKNITGKYGLRVSSATVRNDMAALEKMGLIEQPYTSAGRVPSEVGYRYYVDYLMEKYRLALQEEEKIKTSMEARILEVDRLLNRAGELLSEMTNYPTLVSEPMLEEKKYKQFKLLPINGKKALLVVVLSDGEIKNYQVNLTGNLTEEECNRVTNLLTDKLKGKTVSTSGAQFRDVLSEEKVVNAEILDDVLQVISEAARGENRNTVHIAGTLNIFNQPEFKDLDKVRALLGFFEQQKVLKQLIDAGDEGITIKIGEEVKLEEIEGLSVISSTYCVNGKPVGTIGVIGPTRMTYSQTTSLLEKVAEGLGISLIKLLK